MGELSKLPNIGKNLEEQLHLIGITTIEELKETGFHIIKDYCGKGYATEAALACKNYAFKVLNYERLYSYTILENIPSQKVAKKVGMKLYKHFEKNNLKQIAQFIRRDDTEIN